MQPTSKKIITWSICWWFSRVIKYLDNQEFMPPKRVNILFPNSPPQKNCTTFFTFPCINLLQEWQKTTPKLVGEMRDDPFSWLILLTFKSSSTYHVYNLEVENGHHFVEIGWRTCIFYSKVYHYPKGTAICLTVATTSKYLGSYIQTQTLNAQYISLHLTPPKLAKVL